MDKTFNLKIEGQLGENVLPTELKTPGGVLHKAFANFCRELDAGGIAVKHATWDNAGHQIDLPIAATAGVK